jgi:hypothetical protein
MPLSSSTFIRIAAVQACPGWGARKPVSRALRGMTGLPIPLGTDRSPCDVMMQIAGHGLRIEADQLRTAMLKSQTLRDVLCRFVHVFAVQAEHTALSNALGTVEERLARWLLMVQDRTQSDRLPLTHDLIALMLGTHRAGVTAVKWPSAMPAD